MPPGPPMATVVPEPPNSGISKIWLVAVAAAVVLIGGGVFVALRSGDDADETASTVTVPEITTPNFTIPDDPPRTTLPPGITLPGGNTLPDIALPPDLTIPDLSIPDFSIPDLTIPDTTLPPATTLPDLTLPNGGGLPNGASSVFDQAATSAVVGDLEAYLPGDPTQFTEIVLYPTYAIAVAQDPANPDETVGALWRDGKAGSGPSIPSFDIDSELFASADVQWDKVSEIVAQAPTLLGDPGEEVTHVIVQRWSFEPDLPVRILVYAGRGYVEAGADGTVIGTH